MTKNLADYRRNYMKGVLLEKEVPQNPFTLFQEWFDQMEKIKGSIEVNAMTVSTVNPNGYPKNRVVLLKEFSEEGFIFYTNYTSDKAEAISENPKICLSFFWHDLERQVIISGRAEKSSEEKAVEYFKSRPRGSQLGAWASNQSSEISSREILENRLQELEEEFREAEIPKPDHWGGYLVRPVTIEFWQGRPNRLHDRIVYSFESNNNWNIKRLAP